jgi:hypothetical protein
MKVYLNGKQSVLPMHNTDVNVKLAKRVLVPLACLRERAGERERARSKASRNNLD